MVKELISKCIKLNIKNLALLEKLRTHDRETWDDLFNKFKKKLNKK